MVETAATDTGSYIFKAESGGVNRFSLRADGNIGIASTSPNTRLDIVGGAVAINGGLTNASTRPAVAATRISGEIAGYSSSAFSGDDGFLRLSAGGGTTAATKSYIDLVGYSASVADMTQNIVLGTSGTERMRIKSRDGWQHSCPRLWHLS
jgi:hypothetical protein